MLLHEDDIASCDEYDSFLFSSSVVWEHTLLNLHVATFLWISSLHHYQLYSDWICIEERCMKLDGHSMTTPNWNTNLLVKLLPSNSTTPLIQKTRAPLKFAELSLKWQKNISYNTKLFTYIRNTTGGCCIDQPPDKPLLVTCKALTMSSARLFSWALSLRANTNVFQFTSFLLPSIQLFNICRQIDCFYPSVCISLNSFQYILSSLSRFQVYNNHH